MVKRIRKSDNIRIREINFDYNDGFSEVSGFFKNDPFFSDFDEIFQRMDKLMENILMQNFNNKSNHDFKHIDKTPQIFIEPDNEDEFEEGYSENKQNLVKPDYQKEQDTDAKIYYISPEKLPHSRNWRALGLYVPYMHTIFIADNLPPKIEKFVYYHEIAHSLGIMDEEEADRFAAKKCGYYVDLGKRPKNRYFKFYY